MKTCDTCKWWKKTNTKIVVFGVCGMGVGAVSEYPDEDGCIGDGRSEDGTGDGRTGPKFGCIHWESK